ncbi:MAG: response regulator [Desulfobacter sp.]|nr:MAG: response regulator [Desulfobacter sp.]
MMEGSIQVESTPDKGSLFSFTIFLEKENAPLNSRIKFPYELQSMKILVVENNPCVQHVLQEMLSSFGFSPCVVSTGKQAIERFDHSPEKSLFDLLIANTSLPDMSGELLSQEIRVRAASENLPVIIMDTYNVRKKSALLKHNKSYYFLQKPVIASYLFDAIMEAFGRQNDFSSQSCPETLFGYTSPAIVLLAEDNPINQMVAVEILTLARMTVHKAGNGIEAIEKIKNQDFDVVLMDVQMPEMDGLEATSRIRTELGKKELPIIAMTAHAMRGDREKCIAAGMNDYGSVAKKYFQDKEIVQA